MSQISTILICVICQTFFTIFDIHIYAFAQNDNIFDADERYQWQNQNITCDPKSACSIRCDLRNTCERSIITCPVDHQCTIECLAMQACRGTIIHPPKDESLFSFTFSGSWVVDGLEYPIYPVDDYKDFTLICGNCGGMKLTCPKYANCNLSCLNTQACSKMSITWPVIEGMGNIVCDGQTACDRIDFPVPKSGTALTMNCDTTTECTNSDIYCPRNATCDIYYTGDNSCRGASIFCQSNANCNIYCSATSACLDVIIYSSSLFSNQSDFVSITCDATDACSGLVQLTWTPPTVAPTTAPTIAPIKIPFDYQYDIFLNYDITFHFDSVHSVEINKDNQFNNYTTQSICHIYFGNISNTNSSLNGMDGIFKEVLLLISEINSYTIKSIIKCPSSKLRDGDLFINCTQYFNLLQITMNLSIASDDREYKNIDKLFNDDGVFIKMSEPLLSDFFIVNVTINRVVIQQITEIKDSVEYYIICACIGVISMIFIGYFIYKCHHARVRNTNALKIQNPMVIMIGISFYDNKVKSPEFTGFVNDLDGIEVDIKNAVELFNNRLNYKIFPHYSNNSQMKQLWRKKEIIDLLNAKSKELSTNINNNNRKKNYDGLLVIFSSHGIDNNIITSDYGLIPQHEIHRIFSRAHGNETAIARTIPRVFIFDFCDGSYDKESERRSDMNLIELNQIQPDFDKKGSVRSIKLAQESEDLDYRNTWAVDELNTDYNLAVINGANKHFQSKINSEKGSLLLTSLFTKMVENNHDAKCCVCCGEKMLYLGEIADQAKDELHSKGKRLPTDSYNGNTRNIVFVKNID
eukprot:140559_1